MIILKFIGWVFFITLVLVLILNLFGRPILKWLVTRLAKKMQQQMDTKSQAYQQHQDTRSPFEERVYTKGEIKVTVRRGQEEKDKKKKQMDPNQIEEVDFEDLE